MIKPATSDLVFLRVSPLAGLIATTSHHSRGATTDHAITRRHSSPNGSKGNQSSQVQHIMHYDNNSKSTTTAAAATLCSISSDDGTTMTPHQNNYYGTQRQQPQPHHRSSIEKINFTEEAAEARKTYGEISSIMSIMDAQSYFRMQEQHALPPSLSSGPPPYMIIGGGIPEMPTTNITTEKIHKGSITTKRSIEGNNDDGGRGGYGMWNFPSGSKTTLLISSPRPVSAESALMRKRSKAHYNKSSSSSKHSNNYSTPKIDRVLQNFRGTQVQWGYRDDEYKILENLLFGYDSLDETNTTYNVYCSSHQLSQASHIASHIASQASHRASQASQGSQAHILRSCLKNQQEDNDDDASKNRQLDNSSNNIHHKNNVNFEPYVTVYFSNQQEKEGHSSRRRKTR